MPDVVAVTLPMWAFLLQLLIVGVAIGVIVGTLWHHRGEPRSDEEFEAAWAARSPGGRDALHAPKTPTGSSAPRAPRPVSDPDGGRRAD